MQVVKDSNGGKRVARQRKMLWVEGDRGEWQYAGVLQG